VRVEDVKEKGAAWLVEEEAVVGLTSSLWSFTSPRNGSWSWVLGMVG